MSEYIVNLHGELGMALAVACAGAGFVREEIVRCRDCEFFNEYHGKCHRQSGVLIDDYSTRRLEDLGDVLVLADAEPDGFCAGGVRKDA